MDDSFGHWLAGFVDGEGSFVIASQRGCYNCRMTIGLRDDDTALLVAVAATTGIGLTQPMKGPKASARPNAYVQWVVCNKADALALITLLDRYPLRSKKALDYAIWREAVFVWQKVRTGGSPARRADNEPYWQAIGALRERLNAGRAYRPT